jgi:hypothetical protein
VGLGPIVVSPKFECGSDDCPFALGGVPSVALDCDDAKYAEIHHRAADTMDKIVPAHVVRATAVLGLTAWAAADAPGPIAPRATHAQVAETLKKANMLDALVFQRRFEP